MKRLCYVFFIAIFIFVSELCFSQVMYEVGDYPNSVTAADVSGDGYLDLLVSNVYDSTVSVLINNGNGTFAPHVLYETNSYPYPVVTADVDNDGDIDMLVSNHCVDYDSIRVFINYGDGTFTPGVIYDTPSPEQITLSDVNNDGFVDLLISSFDDVVSVLINNNDGTFASYVSYETEEFPKQVTAADVNNDGYDDMLVSCRNFGNYYSHVMVYLNKCDGTFKLPKSYNVVWDPNRVTAADVNNDGFVDMLVSCIDSARIYVFINNADGMGTFSQKPMLVNYKSGPYPREVTAADVNKDGSIDMLVSSYDEDQGISVFFNDGDGDFKLDNIYRTISPSDITLKDITKDGYPDIVANCWLSSDLSYIGVMLNNGNGTFGKPTLYPTGVETSKVTLADINNDGIDDAITTVKRISVYEKGYVVVWFGQGGGTFGYDPTDTNPPEIAIVTPSDGSEFIGLILVKITASDASLIDKVDIKIDDGDWLPCQLVEDYWEYIIDLGRDFDEKVLRIQARAVDKSKYANTGYSEVISIKVSPWNYSDCYVDAEIGNDDNKGFTIEASLKTISNAVFRVSATQEKPVTVHIAKGLYNKDSGEEFPIEMRSYVSLEGMTENSEDVVIDSTATLKQVITCKYVSDFKLKNLTIKGGSIKDFDFNFIYGEPEGGGIQSIESSFKVKNCIIEQNEYHGIYIVKSVISLDDSVVRNNFRGGIYSGNESNLQMTNCSIEGTIGGYGIDSVYSDLSIYNSQIRDNKDDYSSCWGVYCKNGNMIKIIGCQIEGNKGSSGCGIGFYNISNGIIEDCIIRDNSFDSIPWYGGGLHCSATSSLTVNNCKFEGNDYGISSSNSQNTYIKNCTIKRNKGNGIYNEDSSLTIDNCIISENTGRGVSSRSEYYSSYNSIVDTIIDGNGGGVSCYVSTMNIDGCMIRNNRASNHGVGVYSDRSMLTITNSSIADNCAEEDYENAAGGGIYQLYGQLDISNCEITGNSSVYGGGFHFYNCNAHKIINCLIENNSAKLYGGAIQMVHGAEASIKNTTITNNSAFKEGALSSAESSSALVKNCIIWDNGFESISKENITVANSLIEGGYPGVDIIDADPLFVMGPWGDYYMSNIDAGQDVTSPCVNNGDESSPITGFNKMWTTTRSDGVFDTDALDMGYHYPPSVSFGLSITPEKENYKTRDTFDLLLDVKTAKIPFPADLFFGMVAPDSTIYYGLSWNTEPAPAFGPFFVPENLNLKDVPIMKIVIPSDKPPISMQGEYIFAVAATKPGTWDLISVIAIAGFEVE